MKSALERTYEITKLVKYSPRGGQLFDEIKDDIAPGTPGVRVLCPTKNVEHYSKLYCFE